MRVQTAIIAATIGALAAAGAFGTGDSEAEEQTTTITMWDYQNVEAWTNAYSEIVAKYQETHPNVQVERRALSHEGGEELVKAAALAGNLPDLVPFEPGEPFNTAVEQGIIEDMEPDIAADPEWFSWVERYLADPGMRYNGKGIYRIAADVYHIVSFFYRDLAPAPRTVPELVATALQLQGQGLLPVGNAYIGGYAQANSFGVFVSQQVGDAEQAWDMFGKAARGEISWQNEIFRNAAEAVVEIYGVSAPDSIAWDLVAEEYQKIFNKEAWYFMYLGSWMLGELETQAAEEVQAGNLGVSLYPGVKEGVAGNFYGGGIGAHYSLNADAKDRAATLEWAKFINSPDASEIFLKYSIMPAGAPVENAERYVSSFFAEYLDVVATGKQTPEFNIGYFNPDAYDAYITGWDELFTGDKTVAEYLENMDRVCGYNG